MSELKLLYSERQIDQAVRRLAAQISADYYGMRPLLICVLTGAFIFTADLIRAVGIEVDVDFVRVGSYGAGHVSLGSPLLSVVPETPLEGRNVIFVEDIVDTGRTASELLSRAILVSPASIKLCALLSKPARREKDVKIDYCGFKDVPNKFVVGYGLDEAGKYRGLRDILTIG